MSDEQPTDAEVIAFVVELRKRGKSKAEVWQELIDAGVDATAATGSVAVVERAFVMSARGMSQAAAWQALVDAGAPAAIATAAVSAAAEGLPPSALGLTPCSGCSAAAPSSEMTLSGRGEPLCRSCVQRATTAELDRRAEDATGVAGTVRRCRRCHQPTMTCVQITVVQKGFESTTSYTFTCGACTHSFTGTEGIGPYVMFAVSVLVIFWGASQFSYSSPRTSGKEFLMILAGLGLALFSGYSAMIWQLYPEVRHR